MLDILKLEQFTVLAHHGSYTSAAAALHVSQPTLTRTIQSLEQSLQAKLLDRGRNGVALTEIGVEFLQHAEDLLRHAGSIEADIAARSQGIKGNVRLGAGPSIGGVIMPDVVQKVVESGYDVTLRIMLAQAQTMYSMMLDGELDFFISRAPNPGWSDKLQSTVLGHARTEFWVRPGHPLASQKRVTFADIGKFQRVCGTAWNELLPGRTSPELATLVYATIEVDDSGVMNRLALESDAVLISSMDPGLEGLVRLEIAGRGKELGDQPVMLSRPAHRTLSPAVRYVMKLAADRARASYSSQTVDPLELAIEPAARAAN
jgi:DNA-binding transcriptional LysR family regulator